MMQEQIKKGYDQIKMSERCIRQIECAMRQKAAETSDMKKGKMVIWINRVFRWMPRPVVACALAAVLLLVGECTTYAYTGTGMIGAIISFAENAFFSKGIDENGDETATASFDTSDAVAPAEYKDGKLIFTACGENIDITEEVSETTAYVYTYTDEEEIMHYLIVGGQPENFGYAEFMMDADGVWVGGYFQGGVVGGDIHPEWLENAKDQMNIPW